VVTTPSAKADGFCLVAAALALATAPQALRRLHPAALTPASSRSLGAVDQDTPYTVEELIRRGVLFH
jgi:hypothetical protein